MFYADGMITPAISVTICVERFRNCSPTRMNLCSNYTHCGDAPIFCQNKGTAFSWCFFWPINVPLVRHSLAFWHASNIAHDVPFCMRWTPGNAFNFFFCPRLGLLWHIRRRRVSRHWPQKHLYADMRAFRSGATLIRFGTWICFCFYPALLLIILDKGAANFCIIAEAIQIPFYFLAPKSGNCLPLIYPCDIATVMASQAVHSGRIFPFHGQALQMVFFHAC